MDDELSIFVNKKNCNHLDEMTYTVHINLSDVHLNTSLESPIDCSLAAKGQGDSKKRSGKPEWHGEIPFILP